MTQVYAVLHDRTRVLMVRKRQESYWYDKQIVQDRVNGVLITYWHGPGKLAFPGGGLLIDETPKAGAIREFREETGEDIPEEAIVTGWYCRDKDYWGIYCEVQSTTFSEIRERIERVLHNADAAVRRIQTDETVTWEQLQKMYGAFPEDNELKGPPNDPNRETIIPTLLADPVTDWYGFILQHFPGQPLSE